MMDMNKEKLEKKLQINGWIKIIEKENKRIDYLFKVHSENSGLFFRFHKRNFAYEVFINGGGGDKIIKKDDFFAIIDYLKEQRTDKPLVFIMRKNDIAQRWFDTLENYFELENYQTVNTLASEIKQMIYMGNVSKEICYTTQKEQKEIEHYGNYLLEIDNIGKKNEKNPLFFYSGGSKYLYEQKGFFFSIEDHQCIVSLKMKNDLLTLRITKMDSNRELLKEWKINKKEEIGEYLQEYIEKMEKKQRVRNIYQISTFFFEQYCSVNQIFEWENARDELLQYYTMKQLEEISINFLKNENRKERIKVGDEELCFFDDKAIHFSYNTGKLKVIVNQKEINQHIKEMEKDIS